MIRSQKIFRLWQESIRHYRLMMAVTVTILLSPPALAGAPPDSRAVLVLPPRCNAEAFPLVAFLDSLRVEIAGQNLQCCALADADTWSTAPASVRVKLELVPCGEDADHVQVSVFGSAISHGIDRAVSLADVAKTAQPRALGLVVAELIRSLEQGAMAEESAVRVSEAKTIVSPPAEVRRPALDRYSLHVDAEVRGYPAKEMMMWGGRLRLATQWHALHADIDVGGGFVRKRVELGDVLVRSASMGLTLGPRLAIKTATLDLGLRGEFGRAWIRGESALVDVHTGAGSKWVANLGLRLALEAPAKLRARPSIAIEGGRVILALNGEANGQAVAGMGGYYLLANLGFVLSL
jgi:hypothetical protein